jgi:adenine-specific DNA-methyltransferase
MAEKNGKSKPLKSVETLIHEEASRKNIPTAEFQFVMRQEARFASPTSGAIAISIPNWCGRGKDEQD